VIYGFEADGIRINSRIEPQWIVRDAMFYWVQSDRLKRLGIDAAADRVMNDFPSVPETVVSSSKPT
jgi:hypothetical protein